VVGWLPLVVEDLNKLCNDKDSILVLFIAFSSTKTYTHDNYAHTQI
jgi:hypothetical protein